MSEHAVEIGGFFAVSPKRDCPHIETMLDRDLSHYSETKIKAPCHGCGNVGENWICIVCQEVNCSRYVSSHGVSHFNDTNHGLAISFSDLSVWCHICDAYLEHEALDPLLVFFRNLKFGPDVNSLSRNLEEMKIKEEEDEDEEAKEVKDVGEEVKEVKDDTVDIDFLGSKSIKDFSLALQNKQYKKIAVMAGAGISVSAGIPDFRTPGTGLYSQLAEYNLSKPELLFEINYFRREPEVFFKVVKNIAGEYKPTPTHYFIKLLEQKGYLMKVYTQNIDGLELRAGIDRANVSFAHGHMESSHCSMCKKEYDNEQMKQHIHDGTVAYCDCGHPAKPDVVFFGESLSQEFFKDVQKLAEADLLIILGTSLKVFPFAGLVSQVNDEIPRVMINREPSGSSVGMKYNEATSRDVAFLGDSDDVVAEIVRHAGWEEDFEALRSSS